MNGQILDIDDWKRDIDGKFQRPLAGNVRCEWFKYGIIRAEPPIERYVLIPRGVVDDIFPDANRRHPVADFLIRIRDSRPKRSAQLHEFRMVRAGKTCEISIYGGWFFSHASLYRATLRIGLLGRNRCHHAQKSCFDIRGEHINTRLVNEL